MQSSKLTKRHRRHIRIRTRIKGTPERPRLVVYRSLNNNYAQLIDDLTGKTLCTASDLNTKSKATKTELARKVGEEIGKKASELSITTCVFDRNGYKYHGRIKAIAEGARTQGLKF